MKNKLRYHELTPFQKKHIANGCGGKGGFIKPPDFIFKASCNQHDFYYWRGHNEADREKADKEFYKMMKEDIAKVSSYLKKAHYHIWAYAYYKAVRFGGKKYFYYAPVQKNMKDLVLEIKIKRGQDV
jgi:hypothetical protein